MPPEAPLQQTEHGLVPGEGWFVLNARDAVWLDGGELATFCNFEGGWRRLFAEVGLNLSVLEPGKPMCMYHGEDAQEDFLVLAGAPLLIVEGEERQLRPWDLVHCPPWTEHVIVGAGEQTCVVLAVGARRGGEIRYPVSEAAARHGAAAETETSTPEEAYARFPAPAATAYREGSLPGLASG